MQTNNSQYIDSIRKAIETTYAINASEESRSNANTFVNSLRYSKNCGAVGFELLKSTAENSPQLRFLGWQLVEDQIKQFGNQDSVSPDLLLENLKSSLQAFQENEPLEYLILKAANVTVAAVLRLWPNGIWADFPVWLFQSLPNKFLAFQITQALTEEIIEFRTDPIITLRKPEYNSGLTVAILPLSIIQELYPHGFRADEHDSNSPLPTKDSKQLEILKPIPENENGWLYILLETLNQPNTPTNIKLSILKTFQQYLKWLPFVAIEKVPQVISIIIRSISEASISYDLYKTGFDCLISLCTRSYSSPVEKFQIASLLVDKYAIHIAVYNLIQLSKSQKLEKSDLEPSETIEILRMATQVLSAIIENLVWFKKSSGFAPKKISEVVRSLLFASSSKYITVNEIAVSGLAALQNNTDLILERVDNQLLLEVKNSCIENLVWSFSTAAIDNSSQQAEQIDWEDESDGLYGGNFESFSDYKAFITSRYRNKIVEILQMMAKLDTLNFSNIVADKAREFIMLASSQADSGSGAGSFESTSKSHGQSLISTSFSLIEIAAKSLNVYINSLEDPNSNSNSSSTAVEMNAAFATALSLFEILIKSKCKVPETIRLQLAKIESFIFLIEKKTELILVSLEELTVYLSKPKCSSTAESDEWTRVSYRAASVLEKMIKTSPTVFYNYYFDFIKLATSKESSDDTPTRTKVMLWELPLAFLTLTIPSLDNSKFNSQDVTSKISEISSDMVSKFCQIDPALENTDHIFQSLGISLLDNNQATLQDWIAAKTQRRALSLLVQKAYAFVRPLGTANRESLNSQQNSESSVLSKSSSPSSSDSQLPINLYRQAWEECGPSVMKTALLLARVLHASFNSSVTKSSKWQTYLYSRSSVSKPVDIDQTEYKECAILFTFVSQMLEYVYKIIGHLTFTTRVYFQIDNFGSFWTMCLFGEAPHLPLVVWKSMVDNAIHQSVLANSLTISSKTQLQVQIPNYKLSTQFFAEFFPHLNKFLTSKILELWQQLKRIQGEEGDFSLFEAELRSLTRVYAEVIASLLYGLSSTVNNQLHFDGVIAKKYTSFIGSGGIGSDGRSNTQSIFSAGEPNSFNAFSVLGQSEDGNFNTVLGRKNEKRPKPNLNILHYFSNNQKDAIDLISTIKLLLELDDTIAIRKIIAGVETSLVPVLSFVSFFTKVQNAVTPANSSSSFFSSALGGESLPSSPDFTLDDFWEFFRDLTGTSFDNTPQLTKHLDQTLVYSLFSVISEWLSSDFFSSLIKVLQKGYHAELQSQVLALIASISVAAMSQAKHFKLKYSVNIATSNNLVQNLKSSYVNTSMAIMGDKFDYVDDSNRFIEFLQQLYNFGDPKPSTRSESSTHASGVAGAKESRILFMAAKQLFDKLINLAVLNDRTKQLVLDGSKQVSKHKQGLAKQQRVFGTGLYSGKKSINANILDSGIAGLDDDFDLGNILP